MPLVGPLFGVFCLGSTAVGSMAKSYINLNDRAPPTGYTHAVEVLNPKRMIFVSGLTGRRADGSLPEDVAAQTGQAFANLETLLAQAAMTKENLTKLTFYVTREEDLPAFYQAWRPQLPSPPPAITGVLVKALVNPALLMEFDAIAVE
jgi:enamine deaminase RidA (YjgF/YER057c/UK114 family)